MQISLEEFIRRYLASGLRQPGKHTSIEALAEEFKRTTSQPNGRNFAKWLLSSGKMTRFQALEVLAKEQPELKVGSFSIRQPIDSGPFEGWYAADDGTDSALLVRKLDHPLAVDAAEKYRQLQSLTNEPHLPQFEGPVATSDPSGTNAGGIIAVRLPAGKTGQQVLNTGPITARQAAVYGGDLCQAMERLHALNLFAHPGGLEQIWITPAETALLIPNPLATIANDLHQSVLYQAPELFVAPESVDAQTDIYAMGCLLYELFFGEPVFPTSDHKRLQELHARSIPAKLKSSSPGSATPLQRVLSHCLAKNREARFTSTGDLHRALIGVLATVPAATPPPEPAVAVAQPIVEKPVAKPPKTVPPKPVSTLTETPKVAPAESVPAKVSLPKTPPSQSPTPSKSPTPEPTKPKIQRRKKKKNQYAPFVLGGLGLVLMGLILLLLLRKPGGTQVAEENSGPRPLPPPTEPFKGSSDRGNAESTNTPKATDDATDETRYTIVDDDRLLWASPEANAPVSEPLSLRLLPPGTPLIISFRPAEIGTTAAPTALFDALSPELADGLATIERRVGSSLAEVERATLAISTTADGNLSTTIVAELKSKLSIDDFVKRNKLESAQTSNQQTIYIGEEPASDAYYFDPELEANTRLVVGTLETVQGIAELTGAPMLLPRSQQDLWQAMDAQSSLVLLSNSNFLFADGRSLLQNNAAGLFDTLRDKLVPATSGIAIRMDFQPQWYAELRLTPGGGFSPAVLKNEMDNLIGSLPQASEQFLISSSPDPSWRALAIRLPGMIRAMGDSIRTGISNGQFVANLYLPSEAAPNILLGSWLASNTPISNSTSSVAITNDPNLLTSIDELLDRKLTISFDQLSLEDATETIEQEFNVAMPSGTLALEIIVVGADLQLDGITQNQQIRKFSQTDATLRTILDDVVRRGNPDPPATELYQDAQKLIWVVADNPSNANQQVVLITTRKQAAAKNYQLPPQFAPPQ